MLSHVQDPTETPADRARRECAEQGIDFKITDADALAFVAGIVAGGGD